MTSRTAWAIAALAIGWTSGSAFGAPGLALARRLVREVPRRPAQRALPHRGGHGLVHGQRVDRRRDRHLPERSKGPGVQRDSIPIDDPPQRLRCRRRLGGPLRPKTVYNGRFRLVDSERGLLEPRRFDPEQDQGPRHARPRDARVPRLRLLLRDGGVVPGDGRADRRSRWPTTERSSAIGIGIKETSCGLRVATRTRWTTRAWTGKWMR